MADDTDRAVVERQLGRPPRAFRQVVVRCPFGRPAVTGSHDKTVAVWDLNTGSPLARLALDGSVLCLTWHPDDPLLVAGDMGGNLYGLEYHEP